MIDVCREIGQIIAETDTADLEATSTSETTIKKRLDLLTLKASKNTVSLCDVIEVLTQADQMSRKNSLSINNITIHYLFVLTLQDTLKRKESRRGRSEEDLRESTRKSTRKIEQLVIECHNANIEQRKGKAYSNTTLINETANVKQIIEVTEKLLTKISSDAIQLVELVLAQFEVANSAQAIVDASHRHQSIAGYLFHHFPTLINNFSQGGVGIAGC